MKVKQFDLSNLQFLEEPGVLAFARSTFSEQTQFQTSFNQSFCSCSHQQDLVIKTKQSRLLLWDSNSCHRDPNLPRSVDDEEEKKGRRRRDEEKSFLAPTNKKRRRNTVGRGRTHEKRRPNCEINGTSRKSGPASTVSLILSSFFVTRRQL